MVNSLGLRELKKLRTKEVISNAAIALFVERGFDRVSVAEIAHAAQVSKRTLFAHFATKEDLVAHRFVGMGPDSARVVRERPARRRPLATLLDHHLDGLRDRAPSTGLNDQPAVRDFFGVVLNTPALSTRVLRCNAEAQRELAAALAATASVSSLTADLAAAQIVAVQWRLVLDNATTLLDGESADSRYPAAVFAAEHAFRLLNDGLGEIRRR